MADHILMLDSIMSELRQKCKNKGQDCEICARMAETIEAAKQALSHAAGQEAVAPFAWGYLFPHDGETEHCLSMGRFLPSWVEAKGATEHPLYLAQPSTSAEVGRDAEELRRLRAFAVEQYEAFNRFVAASSGRKEK